jgi:hypothetical protein
MVQNALKVEMYIKSLNTNLEALKCTIVQIQVHLHKLKQQGLTVTSQFSDFFKNN